MLVTPLLDGGAEEALGAKVPPDAAVTLTTPDAGTEAVKPPDKSNGRRRNHSRSEKNGRLAVKTSPYSVVYHKGRKLGTTPMANLPLAPGRYRLVFKNPKFEPVRKTAIIRSGKTTKLDFALE